MKNTAFTYALPLGVTANRASDTEASLYVGPASDGVKLGTIRVGALGTVQVITDEDADWTVVTDVPTAIALLTDRVGG